MMAQHKVIIIFFCGFNHKQTECQALELGLKLRVTATHNTIIVSYVNSWFKGVNGGKRSQRFVWT